MIELIPYFAALIMVMFGFAFYSAMCAFRKMANKTEASTDGDKAAALVPGRP